MIKLLAELENVKDLNLAKRYYVVVEDGKVYIRSGKGKKSKAEIMEVVEMKLQDANSIFNFHEFAYAFEIIGSRYGYTIVANRGKDASKIKQVFPGDKQFDLRHIRIVDTFFRIFDDQIKSERYQQPTWGGIPFASSKISQAIIAEDSRNVKIGELAKEEF